MPLTLAAVVAATTLLHHLLVFFMPFPLIDDQTTGDCGVCLEQACSTCVSFEFFAEWHG